MRILGLHPLDIAIILIFLVAIIWISAVVSRGVKHQTDFFLGGRSLGRWLQFFLNFGNMTDSTGAVQISSNVFRNGIGGIWVGFQTLFITPFYWFSTVWYRRMRLITIADMFIDRFNNGSLSMAYAGFNVFVAIFLLATGNVTTYRVASSMIVKAPASYTAAERETVESFHEYQTLKGRATAGTLAETDRPRFEALDSRAKKDELHSEVSYVNKYVFYVLYTLFVGAYIVMGGLKAAAICDALQGILVVFMSLILIPVGLYALGGFGALHAAIPKQMFEIIGDPATNKYTWYSVLAITFASMIQVFGLIHNMTISGSAKDENAARIGGLSGGFSKRLILIAWGLCGLIALAYFSSRGGLSNSDEAWGRLSSRLLPPGLLGLMLSGMLLGHMPAVGAAAVSISALCTRNLYEPLFKGKSQVHYLRFGQGMIMAVLAASVLMALPSENVVNMIVQVITINTFFGAVVVLVVYWRRLTAGAVWIGFALWTVWIVAGSLFLQFVPGLAHHPALIVKSAERVVTIQTLSTADDVAAGRAKAVGESVEVERHILPVALFFERVVLNNVKDPTSGYHGEGRFNSELYLVSLFGADVAHFTPAWLETARWGVDGVLPFLMLIVFSYLTPGTDPARVRRFLAKMKTPVRVNPEEDKREMELSNANPERFDHLKLFPSSNWEFCKWERLDYLGFGSCWGIVAAIMVVLLVLMRIGA